MLCDVSIRFYSPDVIPGMVGSSRLPTRSVRALVRLVRPIDGHQKGDMKFVEAYHDGKHWDLPSGCKLLAWTESGSQLPRTIWDQLQEAEFDPKDR